MTQSEIFLIALLIIFAVPWLVWRVLRTDYWAPLVVVQIVCGILLGPGVLGVVLPDTYAFVFSPQTITSLNGVAGWAVMLFVWIAGLELDLAQAWHHRRETAVTASLALAVPLLAGSLVALFINRYPGWAGDRAAPWQVVTGIGMACSVTALPILVLLMEKLAILRQPLGQRILRYASLDDIAVWAVLALILLDWDRLGRQGLFLAGFALAGWGVRRLMPRLADADRWAIGLIWLIACGFTADWAGMHYMVGAFLAGAILDAGWFGHDAMDRFRNIILLTVMPIFFLSTGLRTEWSGGGFVVVGVAVLLLAAAVGGKLAGVALAGRILRWQPGEAWTIGWLLQTKALIMIIFANILLDKAIISPATFTALLLMAIGSTMLTVPIVAPRLARLRALVGRDA